MKESKVIPFNQAESNRKKFCHAAQMSPELRDELLINVYQKLMLQIFEDYQKDVEDGLLEFIDEYNISPDKVEEVAANLFWLRMLYETRVNPDFDCFQNFIQENKDYFKQYPVLRSWLAEWKTAVPRFYYIGYHFGANTFYATDIETEKMVEVLLPFPTIKAPARGTIAIATLLPFCDKLYFPLVDFYPFAIEAKEEIIQHLKLYLKELETEPDPYEKFLRIFSTLLKVEHLVRENKISTKNK